MYKVMYKLYLILIIISSGYMFLKKIKTHLEEGGRLALSLA